MEMSVSSYENQAFEPDVTLTSYVSFDPDDDVEVWFTSRSKSSFQLIWENVSREVNVSSGIFSRQKIKKTILTKMTGLIEGGSLTALMGPSGAGKTTLLKIIADKISCQTPGTGVNGNVYVRHCLPPHHAKSFRIGYVPQDDQLFMEFTVKETFMFASKMTNGHLDLTSHESAVKEVMRKLDLTDKANTAIKKLSGGQIKRASIGVELMSHPQILILDEPTSGLDSDTSEKVISLLKNLVDKQRRFNVHDSTAVLCTIHQPSKDVFFLFNNVYLLSRSGQNIYYGPPEGVKEYLQEFGYTSKSNTNPAEFMIEFANAKHGNEKFGQMASQTFDSTSSMISKLKKQPKSRRFSSVSMELPVSQLRMKTSTSFMYQVYLLFCRSVAKHTTKSYWTLAKIMCGLAVASILFNTSKKPFGHIDGCWDSLKVLSSSQLAPVAKSSPPGNLLSLMSTTTTGPKEKFNFNLLSMFTSIKEGTSFAFLTLEYEMIFYAMCLVFFFPLELKTHMKEMSNSWYSPLSLYISRSLSGAVTHLTGTVPMFIYVYWTSHQPMDDWIRPVAAFFVIYTFGMIWETKSELICLVLQKFPPVISVVAVISVVFPALLMSGFQVRYEDMKPIMKPLSRGNDLANAFEANLIATYGFERCHERQLNTNFSYVSADEINMKRMAGSLWSSIGTKKESTLAFSLMLGYPPDYLFPVFDAMGRFFSLPESSKKKKQSKGLSFMLDYYNISNEPFIGNVGMLISTLVIFKILVFVVLKIRASSKDK